MTIRPKIKDLQKFARSYFRRNCPMVRWKKMKEDGLAYMRKNVIYLNPNIKPGLMGECSVGDGGKFVMRRSKQIKVEEGEQYFQVLLHEIGHFKIRRAKPVSKSFYSFKRKMQKEYPNDLDMQLYIAEDYFPNHEKYQEFRNWITESASHMKVEVWAIQEFKKQRKAIKKILA